MVVAIEQGAEGRTKEDTLYLMRLTVNNNGVCHTTKLVEASIVSAYKTQNKSCYEDRSLPTNVYEYIGPELVFLRT